MFGGQTITQKRRTKPVSQGTLVGLDFGAFSLKSARVCDAKLGVRLEQVRVIRYEHPLTSAEMPGNLDQISHALSEARLGGSRWKPLPVACVLPYCMTQMRLLDSPADSSAEGEDLILRELATEGSSAEEEWLGDSWHTHPSLEEGNRTSLGIVGARRAIVDEFVLRLEEQGLEPRIIDAPPFAIARALRRNETRLEEASAALDLGYEGAFFVQLRRGVPRYFRVLRGCGMRGVVEAIKTGLELDDREAHQFLKACSQAARRPSASSKTMLATLRDLAALPLRRLQNELARTLDFARRQADFADFKRITLFGGGALLPGIVSLLEGWADLDFQLWSTPLDEWSEAHADALPLLAQALSLAEVSTSV